MLRYTADTFFYSTRIGQFSVMIQIFGISNCDKVRKTLAFFQTRGLDHQFHDYRKDGLDADWLRQQLGRFGDQQLVNRRSPSYRNLDDAERAQLDSGELEPAISVLISRPTLIKRPLVLDGDWHIIGFDQAALEERFS